MGKMSKRAGAIWVLALGTALSPAVALANDPYLMPADAVTVSPGGVDVRTGRFLIDEPALMIGAGAAGQIELKRTTAGPGEGRLSTNWHILLKATKDCNNCSSSEVSVSVEGVSYTFSDPGNGTAPNLYSTTGYATLARTATSTTVTYTLTTAGGTVVTFNPVNLGPIYHAADGMVYPTQIVHPDGTTYTYTYTSGAISKIVSNAGYALIFENSSSTIKACVINLVTTTAGTTCPTGAQTVTYGLTGNLVTSITDRMGKVWTITHTATSGGGDDEAFYKPGASTPYLTNHWGYGPAGRVLIVLSQDFADGRHFAYSYDAMTFYYSFVGGEEVDKDTDVGTGWTETDANSVTHTTTLSFDSLGMMPLVLSATPASVTDPNGRTYTWHYDLVHTTQLLGRAMPEGNSEAYTYDGYRNRTQVDRTPKSGSGLSHVITSATFGNCTAFSNLLACNQPTATVDARGNQTDYTYSSTHGGVLTVSAPADANGIRAVTRYAYAQRYAWISNGSGGYVQAASPIWVKTEERTCRTTATVSGACAGGSSDEVVTAYDYGPDSGPNNLLLRGVTVTADGTTLRTCYTYDGYGRKISETKPLGTGSSCS